MDYFQGVVTEYLRADRATFVNTEYLLSLDAGEVYSKGRHWYCDAVAINHRDRIVELCEITFSRTLSALAARLAMWSENWPLIVAAIHRDSFLKGQWHIRPRVFIPRRSNELFERKITRLRMSTDSGNAMPQPIVTELEDVLPWKYRSWNQQAYGA